MYDFKVKENYRIGVIGTVGVPARYGGFETLAEQLARNIPSSELELLIYCQSSAYKDIKPSLDKSFYGHKRVFIPLRANGPQSMLYDALAMMHSAFWGRVDAVLILGYSGAWALPFLRLIRPRMQIVTNIDGMEWRRDKFGALAKKILRWLESLAISYSTKIIADNAALVPIARAIYPDLNPLLIAYGGDHTVLPVGEMPLEISEPFYLSIARIEPENNCHMILEAFEALNDMALVFVGNWGASDYGRKLKDRYLGHPRIHTLDPIYDQPVLAALRSRAFGYIHGHSVGGSNPSLIEALFHTNRLFVFDCSFNRSTLEGYGEYFSNSVQLNEILNQSFQHEIPSSVINELHSRYRWDTIAKAYVDAFRECKI